MGTRTSRENQMNLVRTYSLKVVEGSRRVIPECRHVHDQVQPEVSRPKQGKSKRRISNKKLVPLLLYTTKAGNKDFIWYGEVYFYVLYTVPYCK
jgi:hypothetical protein